MKRIFIALIVIVLFSASHTTDVSAAAVVGGTVVVAVLSPDGTSQHLGEFSSFVIPRLGDDI
jgi:hypothetical protein